MQLENLLKEFGSVNIVGKSFGVCKLYFEDYDFKYVRDKLLQSSLFSSNNIVLIKIDKKLPKKEVLQSNTIGCACTKSFIEKYTIL